MSEPRDKKPTPQGELFSRLYLERGAPIQDSIFFRNRLDAYLQANHYKDYAELSSYLKQEAGLIVSTSYSGKYSIVFYNFSDFFATTRIDLILSSITLTWRYLRRKYSQYTNAGKPGPYVLSYPKADAWHAFVVRTLREENMAYILDKNCGVHFRVDEEFERNRVSALKCLDAPRYASVLAAFESAHNYLDAQPPDTKASVRSAFESIEILARLMCPESKNLNKWMVENKLKPIALTHSSDATESDTINKVFDGLAVLIDGLHNYRHGQAVQQPVAPSLALAVYVISVIAAAIRWLVTINDSRNESSE